MNSSKKKQRLKRKEKRRNNLEDIIYIKLNLIY